MTITILMLNIFTLLSASNLTADDRRSEPLPSETRESVRNNSRNERYWDEDEIKLESRSPSQCCYKDGEQIIIVDKDAMDCTCENPEAIATRNKILQNVISELEALRAENCIDMVVDDPALLQLMHEQYKAWASLAYFYYKQCEQLGRKMQDCAHCSDDPVQIDRLRKDYEETEKSCAQLAALFGFNEQRFFADKPCSVTESQGINK